MTKHNCSTHGDWDADEASGCHECIVRIRFEIKNLIDERDRLLVLATKHCPKNHHDWGEILKLAKPWKVPG